MSEIFSIIDDTSVRLPKFLCNFMRDNVEITNDIITMLETLISERSVKRMNNELISEIREQNRTLSYYIKEMSDHHKQTNEMINKLGSDILNNLYVKIHELNKDNERSLELILNKTGNDNIKSVVEKIEKETENIIIRTSNMISEIIPKQDNDFNKQYMLILNEFNKEIISKLELYKTNTISLENLNIILNDKNKLLTQDIQNNIINYLSKLENNIMTTSSNTERHHNTIESEIRKFLDQYKVSSKKGEYSEQILQGVLCSMFPRGEINNVTRDGDKCDFELIRDLKPTILIENKDYENMNVQKHEVQKFIQNVINNNVCGIMISERSGISGKSDFDIEFHNNLVLIYIHKVNYDTSKIQIAIDIIDNLYPKLTELYMNDKFVISNAQINKINVEYVEFIKQRNNIISEINIMMTTMIDRIKKLEISSINNILCSNFSDTKLTNKPVFKCKICDKNYTSAKALSNHLRSCGVKDDNSDDNSNDKPNDKPYDKPDDKSTDKQTDNSNDKPDDKSNDKPDDKSNDKPDDNQKSLTDKSKIKNKQQKKKETIELVL